MKTLENEQLKLKLTLKMNEFIEQILEENNEIGCIPDNLNTLMSDAAFAVLQTVTATNKYFEEQDLLK
jgi:hypothetical protein